MYAVMVTSPVYRPRAVSEFPAYVQVCVLDSEASLPDVRAKMIPHTPAPVEMRSAESDGVVSAAHMRIAPPMPLLAPSGPVIPSGQVMFSSAERPHQVPTNAETSCLPASASLEPLPHPAASAKRSNASRRKRTVDPMNRHRTPTAGVNEMPRPKRRL